MKNLFLLAVAASSFASLPVLANNCMIELQYQGNILGRNAFTGADCRSAMRECKRAEKLYEREHSLSELQCVKVEPGSYDPGNYNGNPGPFPPFPLPGQPGNGNPPRPNPPGPTYPGNGNPQGPSYPRHEITVSGKIENRALNIVAASVGDAYNQCLDFVESARIQSADDMRISINSHKYVRRTTSSWWSTPEAICGEIDAMMTPERLRPVSPSFYPISVTGVVERASIDLNGESMAEVYNSCVDTVESLGLNNADDLMVSVNGHKYQRRTTSSWWNGPVAICDQIEAVATPANLEPVPYRPLHATGRIENREFSFNAESLDGLYNQCVEFVMSSGISTADDLVVSINNDRRQRRTTSSWWSTPTAICDVVTQGL